MISASKKNFYDMTLISKVKKHTGSKKLKEIVKNLRNLSKEDVKSFSELKIKIFEEDKEEKKSDFKISAPIIGFQHYFEEFKKLNSRLNDENHEREDAPSTVDNEEEIKQVDSSDFSEDE